MPLLPEYFKEGAVRMADAFEWAEQATEKLEREFGARLAFVGLQGSRARGEAHEGSDIDLVVLLDRVDADDLRRYRAVVETMPCCELACGFVGSCDVLAAWPRHELFQFANDTRAVRGSLADIVDVRFTRDDAACAARIGASGIYHAVCHALVFDGEAADDILGSLFKGAFFVLQASWFARTGVYPSTKAELAGLLEGDEARILEIGRNWEACRPSCEGERKDLAGLLLRWSGDMIVSGK